MTSIWVYDSLPATTTAPSAPVLSTPVPAQSCAATASCGKLVEAYKRNDNGVNEFWLSHADSQYPVMSILAKEDIAVLHYFREDQTPGMTSVGKGNFESGSTTAFYINTEKEKQEIPNRMIVPFSMALEAAKEFAMNKEPPKCIEWFAL